MNARIPTLPILMVLALTAAGSSAWAGDGLVQGEAARALQRGERLVQQKQYRKAAAEFERASELAGGSCSECLLGVARAYSGAGQVAAAVQVTRMALPLCTSPGLQARAYDQLGALLTLQGEMDAARQAYRKAVELDGSLEPRVRTSMAEALLQRASAAEAASQPQPADPYAVAAPRIQ